MNTVTASRVSPEAREDRINGGGDAERFSLRLQRMDEAGMMDLSILIWRVSI